MIDDTNKENSIRRDMQIQFLVNEKNYISKFNYDFIQSHSPQEADWFKVNKEAFAGINRFLIDQKSNFRLYCALKYESRYVSRIKSAAFILMNKTQYDAWGLLHEYNILFDKQNHDNTFDNNFIQSIINEYEQLGLFAHLTPEEIKFGKEKTMESKIENYGAILSCFPQTVIDFATGDEQKPIKSLLEIAARVSQSTFTPKNIKDDFAENFKNEMPLSNFNFELNGKIYQAELYLDDEEYKSKFMNLINQSLNENNIDGRLYMLSGNYSLGGYLFLTSSQYTFLKTRQPALFEE